MNDLQGCTIGAIDGDIGRVNVFYFDDTSFTVHHLIVDTSGWLAGRKVLISPMTLRAVDWDGKRIEAELTRSQVDRILLEPRSSKMGATGPGHAESGVSRLPS